jgi:DNA-3-methyladenine glycosylase II
LSVGGLVFGQSSRYEGKVSFPELPISARALLAELVARDPDLATIEARAGPLPWRTRPAGFAGLLQAIVAQQISNAAAAAIWGRLTTIPNALDPLAFLSLDDEVLRSAGLSRPKVIHSRTLAAAFAEGRLTAEALGGMSDEEAIAAIASVRGVGRWSAEIYLLFALARMDVFPSGDLALAAAAADLKRLPERPGPKALLALSQQWRPARSLAARLLWHHWRHRTGRPALDDLAGGDRTIVPVHLSRSAGEVTERQQGG